MEQELIRFRQIVRYLVSQGGNITAIGKSAGITWPTINGILNNKTQNFHASTKAAIQDFIKKYNSVPKGEELPIPEKKSEETNYSVLEFFVRVRELLQNVPKGYKIKIEIEKT